MRKWRWWWVAALVLIGVLFLTVGTLAQTAGPIDSISMTVGGKVFFHPRTSAVVVPEV